MDPALKSVLRQQALAARDVGGDGAALTESLTAALASSQGQIIAGYWPMRGEADPRPALESTDGTVCLPVVLATATPLIFRLYDGRLETGRYDTRHPVADCAEVTPTVIIVPLVAFDRQGARLGYGGGFYDRTLQALRAAGPVRAIGLAFASQELPHIPTEPTDQPLDEIVTDRGVLTL